MPLLLKLIAAMAVIFAIGLLLLWREVDVPLERLLAVVRRAESSVSATLPAERFGGPLRQLVHSLNRMLQSASTLTATLPPPPPPPPGDHLSQLSLGNRITLPPIAGHAASALSPAQPTEPATAAPASPFIPPNLPVKSATSPVVTFTPAPLASSFGPPSPALATVAELEPTAPRLPAGGLAASSVLPMTTDPALGIVDKAMPTHVHSEETRVAVGAGASDDPQTIYFRVYQDFVLARERCQESVEGLNFDVFRQRLQQSREQIMNQHNCQTVQFQVHIKDGRATLRATPIWN
jgi:hypothetical protein